MTPAETVRTVLLEAGVLDEQDSWRFVCDELARAARAARGGDAGEVAKWLDLLRLAVEGDPETQALAARIVERVGEADQ